MSYKKYLDKKLTRKTSNILKPEKKEDIAVIRYNQGRHQTGKSVQCFFTAEQKGENLRFSEEKGLMSI